MEAYALGLGEPVPLSAEHNLGLSDLRDSIAEIVESNEISPAAEAADVDKPLQLAIVGRPNVGKSTLVNKLVGEDRVLTGPEAGITRDAIAIEWCYKDRPIRLIDTAGLRRRAKAVARLEKLSAADTQRAVNFAHVVVLLLDAEAPMENRT